MIRRMNCRGFTLVEILVVMVIMGLVVTAVYTTFLTTQRQAYTQDEVVEVQQNLRAALDYIAKDIRMAQFLIPAGQTAIVSAPAQMTVDDNSDGDYEDPGERPLLSLVSATSQPGYARVTGEPATGTLDVAANTAQQFAPGDMVRIFRPVDLNPVTQIYPVSGTSGDQVTLNITSGGYAAGVVSVDDLLVRMPIGASNSDFPLQINYQLVDDPSADANMNQLQRQVTNLGGTVVVEAFQLIATNISGVALTYLNDAGTSTSDPAKIVAIQITITGRTDATKTGQSNFSGVKERSLSTTVKIHNGVRL